MLKVIMSSLDDVPDAIKELYTERDGQFVLTGVEGVKTQSDIDRLTTSLNKEREEHKATKSKLQTWGDMDHDEVMKKLDRMDELEVAAKGKVEEMDAKLEDMTEARVKSRLAPVERELAKAKKDLDEITGEVTNLRQQQVTRAIQDDVRAAMAKAKTRPEAEQDVLLLADAVFERTEDGSILTKENNFGIEPGLSPDVFLSDMQEKRPHWWPAATGGGAGGSGNGGGAGGANNPWGAKTWNLTEQGRYLKEHGEEKAQQLAKAAGTTIGGMRPTDEK